jgi:hypothetical protein
MWYTLFLSEINKRAPLKTKRIKYAHQPEWLTDDIKDAQKKRNHFHKSGDWVNFRYWRNKCKTLIEKSKLNYFHKIMEENKEPKEIRKLFKDLNPKKQNNFPPSMKFENETCSDFKDIINRLNNFFSKIGSSSASADCLNENFEKLSDFIQSKVPFQVEFRIPFIKLDQTESLLNKLDTSKATGLDDLGPYCSKYNLSDKFKYFRRGIPFKFKKCKNNSTIQKWRQFFAGKL